MDAQFAALRAGQHQQILGEARQPVGFFRRAAQRRLQLLGRPRARQRKIEFGLHDGQWCPEFMAGVVQQPLLAAQRVVQPVKQRVQGPAEPGDLIVREADRQPPARLRDRDRGRLLPHGLHGPQRGSGEEPCRQDGQRESGRVGHQQQQPEPGQRLVHPGEGGPDDHEQPPSLVGRQHEPRLGRRSPRRRELDEGRAADGAQCLSGQSGCRPPAPRRDAAVRCQDLRADVRQAGGPRVGGIGDADASLADAGGDGLRPGLQPQVEGPDQLGLQPHVNNQAQRREDDRGAGGRGERDPQAQGETSHDRNR